MTRPIAKKPPAKKAPAKKTRPKGMEVGGRAAEGLARLQSSFTGLGQSASGAAVMSYFKGLAKTDRAAYKKELRGLDRYNDDPNKHGYAFGPGIENFTGALFSSLSPGAKLAYASNDPRRNPKGMTAEDTAAGTPGAEVPYAEADIASTSMLRAQGKAYAASRGGAGAYKEGATSTPKTRPADESKAGGGGKKKGKGGKGKGKGKGGGRANSAKGRGKKK